MAAKMINKNDALIITPDLPSVGIQEAREYLATLKAYSQPYKFLIFNFSEVTEISAPALRALSFSAGLSVQIGAKISIVGTPKIKQSIADCGLEKLFPFFNSIDEIFQVGSQPSLLRNDLSAALEDAVKNTILTITGHEAHQVFPTDSKNQDYSQNFQIGAIVGIIGKSFKGSMILGFSEKTFLNLISKMFEVTYPEVTDEICDGPAEILNMIFGNLKIALNEKSFGISTAIPTTIRGSNLRIVPSSAIESPAIVLVFETEFGTFYVEMSSNSQSLAAAA